MDLSFKIRVLFFCTLFTNGNRTKLLISYVAGSPCDNYKGYCDVLDKCRRVDAEGPLSRLKNFIFNKKTFDSIYMWMKEKWWACVLIGLGLVLLMAGKYPVDLHWFVYCPQIHAFCDRRWLLECLKLDVTWDLRWHKIKYAEQLSTLLA